VSEYIKGVSTTIDVHTDPAVFARPIFVTVMLIASVPSVTLLLALIGAGTRIRNALRRIISAGDHDPRATHLLWGLAFLSALTAHEWMLAYVMIALFAGRGLFVATLHVEMALAHRSLRVRQFARGGLWFCAVAAPLGITTHAHPFDRAFTPIVGGAQ